MDPSDDDLPGGGAVEMNAAWSAFAVPGTDYAFVHYAVFILLGVCGGLFGGVFCQANFRWSKFFRQLPLELEEAARIDGASSSRILRSIVLPLSWPGIVVSAIFAFLLGWNDVLFSTIMTTPNTRTVAVVLQVLGTTQEGGAVPIYGQMMAASIVCAAPVVALYLVFQRYLVGGLTAGSVK